MIKQSLNLKNNFKITKKTYQKSSLDKAISQKEKLDLQDRLKSIMSAVNIYHICVLY